MSSITTLELLAPARNADIAIQAINHGADAVYIAASSHGARAAAANSIDDIRRVVDYAHRFRARVYVTVNTIVYDSEIPAVERMIAELYKAGVDALIVQDMGILRMAIPPISLHASTQCDTRNAAKAAFLASAGFNQIVLARELTPAQIADIRREVPQDVELEAFVHGALCVSYSGDCQAGFLAMGRSANRGECPQMCRLPYDLRDGNGQIVAKGKHLLSLRDMCRIDHLSDLINAGVTSFKIEGRLKDSDYVRNVVGAYHQELNRVISNLNAQAGRTLYQRRAVGRVNLDFAPDVTKSFNRGFTPYFITRARTHARVGAIDSPKMIGEPIGTVVSVGRNAIKARLNVVLSNGDGLGFFDKTGQFTGFRLNKVEGTTLFPAPGATMPQPGTTLYRNSSALWDKTMRTESSRRTIGLECTLTMHTDSQTEARVSLSASLEALASPVTVVSEPFETGVARSPQTTQRQRTIAKLGGTEFALVVYDDSVGDDIFIPLPIIADLRRQLVDAIRSTLIATHPFEYRRSENVEVPYPNPTLTYHDNVANSYSEAFYHDHKAEVAERALEVSGIAQPGQTVMTTRYCLRRQLGACLLDKSAKKLAAPLYIESGPHRYELEFDCKNCLMHLKTTPRQ